jgi:hypothetical protein
MQLTERIIFKVGAVMVNVCAIGIAALMIFTLGLVMWRSGQAEIAMQALNDRVSVTAPGRFAVENFTACKNAGGALSSPDSDAHCISETITGAEKLKGSGFSTQVTQELAGWLEENKKLRAK